MAERLASDLQEQRRETNRHFMWPFVITPLLFIAILHVGARIPWFFGYGPSSTPPAHRVGVKPLK